VIVLVPLYLIALFLWFNAVLSVYERRPRLMNWIRIAVAVWFTVATAIVWVLVTTLRWT
jgi:hypothetical protein